MFGGAVLEIVHLHKHIKMNRMKLKLLSAILVMLLILPLYGKADITTPLEPPTTEDPVPTYPPSHNKHKAPPAPVLCFIDFEAGTVSFSSEVVGEIEEYLICDESGENCISSYDDPAEFVAALNVLNGDLCIKFLSPKGYYTGFITK